MGRKVGSFKFESHGIDSSSYFQGAGTAYSQWEECYTGVGESEAAAADDAIENLATSDWDLEDSDIDVPEWASKTEDVHNDCLQEFRNEHPEYADASDDEIWDMQSFGDWHEECEVHYFVTVYVRESSEEDDN